MVENCELFYALIVKKNTEWMNIKGKYTTMKTTVAKIKHIPTLSLVFSLKFSLCLNSKNKINNF